MNIYQVIHGVSNASAGPTYSVTRLAEQLTESGHQTEMISFGQQPKEWNSRVKLKNFEPDGMVGHVGYNSTHINYIKSILNEEAIIHGHGVWRLSNLFPLFKHNPKAKLFCSPRGMLTPWSMNYKKWIKLPFWKVLQKPALDRVDFFHVTSEMELEDLRKLGFKQPAVIIPNGIDIPDLSRNMARIKNIVFLSRIDPKKGLDILLPAWKKLSSMYPDWHLKIVGPLESSYAKSVVLQAKSLALNNIEFTGAVHGKDKEKELSQASLFVLPTYSENFGIVVAEAFAHGVPVITTTETPWLTLDAKKCGWTIKPDLESLVKTMSIALSLSSSSLSSMGEVGREWMKDEFSWISVAEKMMNAYDYAASGNTQQNIFHH